MDLKYLSDMGAIITGSHALFVQNMIKRPSCDIDLIFKSKEDFAQFVVNSSSSIFDTDDADTEYEDDMFTISNDKFDGIKIDCFIVDELDHQYVIIDQVKYDTIKNIVDKKIEILFDRFQRNGKINDDTTKKHKKDILDILENI